MLLLPVALLDSASAEYPLDYTAMVAAFKALTPPPKVYVMIPPPLYAPYPYSMNSTVINGTFPALIPKIAAAAGADGVINIFSALKAAGDLTCDGCHPIGKHTSSGCQSCTLMHCELRLPRRCSNGALHCCAATRSRRAPVLLVAAPRACIMHGRDDPLLPFHPFLSTGLLLLLPLLSLPWPSSLPPSPSADAGYQVIAQTMFDFLTAHAVPQVIEKRGAAATAAMLS